MRRKFLIYFQPGIHWFLLISVLTGIFFSSGEGLQLFPFSVAVENTNQDPNYNQKFCNKSYTESTHNFTNQSFSTNTNLQKNIKNEIVLGSSATNCLLLNRFLATFAKATQIRTQFFYSSNYYVSTPSRAPPKI